MLVFTLQNPVLPVRQALTQPGFVSQFPPGISMSDTLTVWVYELFRSATLVFKQHTQFHGVDLLRFVPVSEFIFTESA